MSNNTIISTGTTYRIYDSSVETHDVLPKATYRVEFDPMSGYSLLRVEPLTAGEEKVYGSHEPRLNRISQAYSAMTRSLGVLLSGDKGMGKSLMVRMVAEKFANERDLPIILVESNTPGIASFIDTLGESVVVFDEFEKKFPAGGRMDEGDGAQSQFLGLFDGISSTQRLYLVSINEVSRLSDFFINRPGRFHYHIRFDYPAAAEVREYLTEQAPGADPAEIETAVTFSQRVKLNYDHLRALAFELNLGGTFSEVIGDLNIKNMGGETYKFTVELDDGTKIHTNQGINFFAGAETPIEVETWWKNHDFEFEFALGDVQSSDHGMFINGEDIEVKDAPEGTAKVARCTIELVHQRSIGF